MANKAGGQVGLLEERWRDAWKRAFSELKELLPETASKRVWLKRESALWAEIRRPLEAVHLVAFCFPLHVKPERLEIRVWCREGAEVYNRLKAAGPLNFQGRILSKDDDCRPRDSWAAQLDAKGISVIGLTYSDEDVAWLVENEYVASYAAEVLASLAERMATCAIGDSNSPGTGEDAKKVFLEGAVHEVRLTKHERDEDARLACIQHYGPKCQVCGIDFGLAYGEVGTGFIHVHHLVKISSSGAEHEVDPVTDLRPVCPNCHAMLHRKDPPYTLEEIATNLKK